MNKSIENRTKKMSYKNFNLSIYCPVDNINSITDFEDFDQKLKLLYGNMKIGHAYLECFREMMWCDKEQLIKVKTFFEQKGIATSGGITTCDAGGKEGYASLCYSDEKSLELVKKAVALNAEVFDEFILDDFYFINCRCPKCVEKKGGRTWGEFRHEQKKWVSQEIIMKTAKAINPDINVIIKFPQWYEAFGETGYDLIEEPEIFDSIYTGTETRNPAYSQQHLPKYLSYFIMRYLESAAPGHNLGGWFDPYECTYNLTSYLEQGYLTLFAKAKEVTLFCLNSLMKDPDFRQFPPAMGQLLEEMDEYLDKLGNPIGVAAYRPGNGSGEDNVHSYLGMCGIPLEPCIQYPKDEKIIFLAEGAADDKDIVTKMKESLLKGADIIVTSGFLRKLGSAFDEFVTVKYTSRKAIVSEYADSKDNGLSISGKYTGKKKILIPQIDYATNDIWELAAAYGTDNNFPIVLRCAYGNGRISVVTIPDDMGDLYHYPPQVLRVIRNMLSKELPVTLEGPSGILLLVYDNHTFILRSDLPYTESVTIHFKDDVKTVRELRHGVKISVTNKKMSYLISPGVNYILEIQ